LDVAATHASLDPESAHVPVPDPDATRREITRLSVRGYTVLRHVLYQLPRSEAVRVSTVGRLLTQRRHRALLAYLLLLTSWPWLEGRREPLEAAVWVRALTTKSGLTWSPSTLSRAWNDLEKAGLIIRKREGRTVRIAPRREDGGADYITPQGDSDRWNTYFVLPDTFWLDETFGELSFPALAMLLIIAGETSDKQHPEMPFAYEWATERYGLSPKSAQKGIKELEARGLVHRREERIAAPLSAVGYTVRTYYSLTGPYGQQARLAAQQKAKTERAKRAGKKAVAEANAARRAARTTATRKRAVSKRARTNGDPPVGRQRRAGGTRRRTSTVEGT
jgi:DNA-binding transcriptional ArsR family regulator